MPVAATMRSSSSVSSRKPDADARGADEFFEMFDDARQCRPEMRGGGQHTAELGQRDQLAGRHRHDGLCRIGVFNRSGAPLCPIRQNCRIHQESDNLWTRQYAKPIPTEPIVRVF